jgi:hypothetical protein
MAPASPGFEGCFLISPASSLLFDHLFVVGCAHRRTLEIKSRQWSDLSRRTLRCMAAQLGFHGNLQLAVSGLY